MKIYISLPITGHDMGQCKALAKDVARIITKRGHTAITPFDVSPEESQPYSCYMGKDIAAPSCHAPHLGHNLFLPVQA